MTPHERALVAAALAMAAQGYGRLNGIDPEEEKISETDHFQRWFAVDKAPYIADAQTAISSYLSSIGGIVCAAEPAGAWYEDSTGCVHMSLNVALEEEKARENGHPIHYFHEPIPDAGNVGDGWFDMASAPKDGANIQVWAEDFKWPEVIRYEPYEPEIAKEIGEPGYWRYSEELLADVAQVDVTTLTHWRPLHAPPSRSSDGRGE